ncbi:MAG: sulfotransferase domain-containing protein [Pseudomonadota bacterium]
MRVIRYNLSSMGRRFASADGIVVSIPKSGRTWLRVLLSAYCCRISETPFVLDPRNIPSHIPHLFEYTHDLWEHAQSQSLKDKLRNKFLIPASVIGLKPILLMARDPRDVIVSLYMQKAKRSRSYRGSILEMIGSPSDGINPMIDVMNDWLGKWAGNPRFMMIRYEDIRKNPHVVFRDILTFLGFADICAEAINASVEFADFNNMKKMEAKGSFDTKILRPGDASDNESFKVRRGLVGGYRDYLGERELEIVEAAMVRLNPAYGYQTAIRPN